jgi:NAD(P)-dependent dehydrogenase (short-subunit alcohol dehydrogenase family)
MADLVSKHPIGFLGAPEDIGRGILFLASDDSRFMTGAELVMDGGFELV